MSRVAILAFITTILAVTNVYAAGIDGRLGLTGKLGFQMPVQDDLISGTTKSRTGFAAGGGLIYGLGNNFAAELDITHAPSLAVENGGGKVGEVTLTDISLGLQYRFTPDRQLVPYLGAGVDFIQGSFTNNFDDKFDLSWTTGGHVSAGVDYFVTRGVAFTAELKGVFAPKGDLKTTALEYDPTSFLGMVGVRLFLPEHPFD
ncbi:porin family protein [Geomonas azotofigens]|uniref:porin family protein n=1 Tax=Geomonas azotofigens TaxID=2843196 RepID=UPI001C11712C|nr:porin family protein [Geomonas azotofigens]MBU5612494.1 porin family protein [Geomonas azotofigens]